MILQILDSALRLATPLLFACLAGLISERSGVFDIGLEGKILASAFMSASVAAFTGSVWLGLLGGIAASVVLALIHGIASITFRGNQLISGVAINFLASGTTVVIGENWFGLGGRTPQLQNGAELSKLSKPFVDWVHGIPGVGQFYDWIAKSGPRFQDIDLPFAEALKDVPVLGPIYNEVISGHSILVYVGLLAVLGTWWLLFRTRFGLRLRAVGENPESVDTAGVSVIRLRYSAVLIAGVLCGLAGTYLATGLAAGFVKEMSAGRGFIALAAMIFAKWRPGYALLACLLFGLLEALGNRFQNIDILGIPIPVQFMQALPYILTVVILAGFVGKAIPPRAGGQPYVKER